MPRFAWAVHLRQLLFLLLAGGALGGSAQAQIGSAGSCLIFTFEQCSSTERRDWDKQMVESFLAVHNIPTTDSYLISTYGREDLYNHLRSFALVELMALAQLPAAERTATQNNIVNSFTQYYQAREIEAAQFAVDHKNDLKRNQCTWVPDPQIAKAFAITYDGTFHCGQRNALFTGSYPPKIPGIEYFQSFGQKRAYFEPLSRMPLGLENFRELSNNGKIILGVGIPGGAAIGLTIALAIAFISKVEKFFIPFTANPVLAGATVGITILIMVAVIVLVVLDFYESQAQLAALDKLDTDLQAIRVNPPNLGSVARDQKASNRLAAAFALQSFPTGTSSVPRPTPAPLPVRAAHDPIFLIRNPATNSVEATPTLRYKNWSSEVSTAQMYGGWFTQQIGLQGSTYDSFGFKLHFLIYNKLYTLDRIGGHLYIIKEQPEKTDVDCPVGSDGYTTYTTYPLLTTCKTFIADTVLMDLPEGQRMVSISQAPRFITPPEGAFTLQGGAQTITVQATGVPAPSLHTSSALPIGVSVQNSNQAGEGRARLIYDGVSGLPTNQDIVFIAGGANGSVTQTFKLQMSTTVKIAFSSATEVEYGKFASVPVSVTGNPRPALSITTPQPIVSAVPFCRMRPAWTPQGQAVIEGTPLAEAHIPNFWYCEGYLKADNGLTSHEVLVRIPMKLPTQPLLRTREFAFNAGVANSFLIQTAPPSDIPVTIEYPRRYANDPNYAYKAPAWLQLTDHGNGTATLSGTPPPNAPDQTQVQLDVYTRGSQPNPIPEFGPNLMRVNVIRHPVVTTAEYGIFNTFQTAEYNGALSIPGQVEVHPLAGNVGLPAGFALVPTGDRTFRIFGRGYRGTDVNFLLRSFNSTTTNYAWHPFRMIIGEPPKLSMPFSLNFYIGQSRSLPILAGGFPIRPIEGIPNAPGPMDISYRGTMPPGLQFVTTDPEAGPTYGRVIIRGTATTPGSTMLVIHADNGVVPAASQSIFLNVTIPGDVTVDGRVDCNDVRFITSKYGQGRGSAGYDWNADYNLDGNIDVRDLAQVSARLPAGTRCQ